VGPKQDWQSWAGEPALALDSDDAHITVWVLYNGVLTGSILWPCIRPIINCTPTHSYRFETTKHATFEHGRKSRYRKQNNDNLVMPRDFPLFSVGLRIAGPITSCANMIVNTNMVM